MCWSKKTCKTCRAMSLEEGLGVVIRTFLKDSVHHSAVRKIIYMTKTFKTVQEWMQVHHKVRRSNVQNDPESTEPKRKN